MRKRSCLSVIRFVFILFFSISAFAVEIADPNKQLAKLWGSRPDFIQAFTCGKPAPFFVRTGQCSIFCEFGMCEQTCDWPEIIAADFQVEECTNKSVQLYSTHGHAIEMTAEDYKASNNSIALSMIKALPIFFQPLEKIKIDWVGPPVAKKFIENGKMTTVYMTPIYLVAYPDMNKDESTAFQLNLDLSRSGLDQLLCFTEDDNCRNNDMYFLKRKGLVGGTQP